MSRAPGQLVNGFCYHVTTRCNNREFNLSRRDCREVLLYAIKKAQVNEEDKGQGAEGRTPYINVGAFVSDTSHPKRNNKNAVGGVDC